jgi:hypothetical protein
VKITLLLSSMLQRCQGGLARLMTCCAAEVSGGACQQDAAQQAELCLSGLQTQLTHVRQAITTISQCIHKDVQKLEVEERHIAALHSCTAGAQNLLAASRSLRTVAGAMIGINEAGVAAEQRVLQQHTDRLQAAAEASGTSSGGRALQVNTLPYGVGSSRVHRTLLEHAREPGCSRCACVVVSLCRNM